MLGIDYLRRIYQVMQESSTSGWMDQKNCFDFLYEAACDFAREAKLLRNSTTLTTVANQAAYALPPDFLQVSTKDDHGLATVEYTVTSTGSVQWLNWSPYEDVQYAANTTSVEVPSQFGISDAALDSQITGTTTSSGAAVNGESTLTNTEASFSASTIYVGDDIYNTTQGYIGKVLSIISATDLKTAMFSIAGQSAYVGWESSEEYIIQPQPHYQIIIDPPPKTSGDTVLIPYWAKPLPVYSDIGSYRFATGYEDALVKYCAWLMKYKNMEPQFGDMLYRVYDLALRKAKNMNRKAQGAVGFRVNWTK